MPVGLSIFEGPHAQLSQRVMGAAPIDAIVPDALNPAQSSIRLIESISAGNTLREGN